MLSYPGSLHPRGLRHLLLRGPGFNTQSTSLSRKLPCDMTVTSAPHAMPPQHLWDPKQNVHISRGHYKRRECPYDQFSNSPFTICSLPEFLCVDTLSTSSLLTAALHVEDLILNFILCAVGNWEPFHCWFILPKRLASGKQGITEKQREQAGAEYKTNKSRTFFVKAVQISVADRYSLGIPATLCSRI